LDSCAYRKSNPAVLMMQSAQDPAYAESVLSGSSAFALAYGA
jgi:hypothetical protein